MSRNGIALICVSLLLTSCATNFSTHLESSIKDGEVSELGLASKFVIVDTDSSSRKINYSYEYLAKHGFEVLAKSAFENYALSRAGLFKPPQNVDMAEYAEYTKNKEVVTDLSTKKLITKRLERIGMTEGGEAKNRDVLLLSYEELMGWDMGEIVKEM